MSRVCRLAGLKDVEVHATPVYSLLWNIVILLVLVRLLAIGTTTTMICGIYLLLGGMGRFVEEAYRGEPQTATLLGLRLYQWLGIASAVIGIVFTTITDAPLTPVPQWHPTALVTAAICGALAWLVCAIDFPRSERRFARLT